MRYWFDTEFIEDGETIKLLSIGVVSEDSRIYYAEPECDRSTASVWIKQNVFPHLSGETVPRPLVANQLIDYFGEKPEIWGYYADYDWVALCQLYGTMLSLPKTWPMYCLDVKQLAHSLGNPKLPDKFAIEHNALSDALWTKQAWKFLENYKSNQ